uniref:3'-5' exonuclease domain-containing protein n=1 Tax=Romanomermis culicivorax TaxID=13658 RepID=A0A915HEU2_ROMCU
MVFAWDLVVFTTMDASQNLAFEEAIRNHKKEQIFEKCDFRIYVDDGNSYSIKLGSGGATLLAIRKLFLEYGQSLFEKRILMIPVGGYSQRQPNCSALGKLFLELPTLGYPMTILDFKLNIYNKFLRYLPPGILLAASDTVEYYADLPPGFTLLTFQSSLETAQNHGVFVLNREKIRRIDEVAEIFGDVIKVLQKPTPQELESENAVIKSIYNYAYIDGLYFMASDVVEKITSLANHRDFEIDREICAYADFLRPLGTLKDTLNHFCNLESDFARTFNFCQLSNVHLSNMIWLGVGNGCTDSVKCCAISSIINEKSSIPKLTLIENCDFRKGIHIPDRNIVLFGRAIHSLIFREFRDFRYFGKSEDQTRDAWAFALNYEISSFKLFNTINSSLWYAKLFPCFPTMGESFFKTIRFLDALKSGIKRQKSCKESTSNVENIMPTTTARRFKFMTEHSKNDDVTVVSSVQHWENILPRFKNEIANSNVIGFDCEWVEVSNWARLYGKKEMQLLNRLEKSCARQEFDEHLIRMENTRRDKVSLLQLSAVSGYTILIRLILFKYVPDSLKMFLEDARIIKVGVNIFSDCSRLHKDWGILVNSWLDMRFLVNDLPNCKLSEPTRNGLKAMGEVFCNETVRYSDKMRYSNWCGVELDYDQIHYASQDSKIAIESFVQLMQEYLLISKKEKYVVKNI